MVRLEMCRMDFFFFETHDLFEWDWSMVRFLCILVYLESNGGKKYTWFVGYFVSSVRTLDNRIVIVSIKIYSFVNNKQCSNFRSIDLKVWYWQMVEWQPNSGTISRDNKNEMREREICIRISLGNSDQVRQRNVKRPTTILIFRVI